MQRIFGSAASRSRTSSASASGSMPISGVANYRRHRPRIEERVASARSQTLRRMAVVAPEVVGLRAAALFECECVRRPQVRLDVGDIEQALAMHDVVERARHRKRVDRVAEPSPHQRRKADAAFDHRARSAQAAVVGVHEAEMDLSFVLRRCLRNAAIVAVVQVDRDPGRCKFHRNAGALKAATKDRDTHASILALRRSAASVGPAPNWGVGSASGQEAARRPASL